MYQKNSQSGQIGLIVLLIMTSMLTVGIGAISRSTQDVNITRQEYESSQLFNQAEAGVEAALAVIEAGNVDLSSGPYNGTTRTGDENSRDINFTITQQRSVDTVVLENQMYYVHTKTSDTSNNSRTLSVSIPNGANTYNCDDNNNLPPKLIVKIYSSDGTVQTTGVKFCSPDSDGFIARSYNFDIQSLSSNVELVTFRPIGGELPIQVTGGWLPVQGYEIESTAVPIDGDEAKKIVVNRSVQIPISVLSYALFSGTSIIMN